MRIRLKTTCFLVLFAFIGNVLVLDSALSFSSSYRNSKSKKNSPSYVPYSERKKREALENKSHLMDKTIHDATETIRDANRTKDGLLDPKKTANPISNKMLIPVYEENSEFLYYSGYDFSYQPDENNGFHMAPHAVSIDDTRAGNYVSSWVHFNADGTRTTENNVFRLPAEKGALDFTKITYEIRIHAVSMDDQQVSDFIDNIETTFKQHHVYQHLAMDWELLREKAKIIPMRKNQAYHHPSWELEIGKNIDTNNNGAYLWGIGSDYREEHKFFGRIDVDGGNKPSIFSYNINSLGWLPQGYQTIVPNYDGYTDIKTPLAPTNFREITSSQRYSELTDLGREFERSESGPFVSQRNLRPGRVRNNSNNTENALSQSLKPSDSIKKIITNFLRIGLVQANPANSGGFMRINRTSQHEAVLGAISKIQSILDILEKITGMDLGVLQGILQQLKISENENYQKFLLALRPYYRHLFSLLQGVAQVLDILVPQAPPEDPDKVTQEEIHWMNALDNLVQHILNKQSDETLAFRVREGINNFRLDQSGLYKKYVLPLYKSFENDIKQALHEYLAELLKEVLEIEAVFIEQGGDTTKMLINLSAEEDKTDGPSQDQ